MMKHWERRLSFRYLRVEIDARKTKQIAFVAASLFALALQAADQSTQPGLSKLAELTSGLKKGEWAAFDGPPKSIGNYGISWQPATGYWDAKNREFQFMAKAQGGGAPGHYIYSEANHIWRPTLNGMVLGGGKRGLPGHIWSRSFDPTTGDYYFMDSIQSSNFLRIMRRSVEAGKGSESKPWIETSKPDFGIRGGHEEEIGYHPNLYGPGDGGVIQCGQHNISAWRKKTDSWEVVMPKCEGEFRQPVGGGQYLPGFDRLVLGGRGKSFIIVEAGKDGKLSDIPLKLESCPIAIRGNTSRSLPWGKLVVHPGNDKCLVILGPMPDYKVWTNVTGGTGDDWVEEEYSHPFTKENLPMTGGDWGAWTCGSVSTHGVVWGLAYDGKVSKSVLWKPQDPTIKDAKKTDKQEG